jgi:hypothetical protein
MAALRRWRRSTRGVRNSTALAVRCSSRRPCPAKRRYPLVGRAGEILTNSTDAGASAAGGRGGGGGGWDVIADDKYAAGEVVGAKRALDIGGAAVLQQSGRQQSGNRLDGHAGPERSAVGIWKSSANWLPVRQLCTGRRA